MNDARPARAIIVGAIRSIHFDGLSWNRPHGNALTRTIGWRAVSPALRDHRDPDPADDPSFLRSRKPKAGWPDQAATKSHQAKSPLERKFIRQVPHENAARLIIGPQNFCKFNFERR